MKRIYALVDCNSFFCSCERVFRPDLKNRPVGVLSNNDGCFVARTKEFKNLDIPMGAPYFKYKDVCRKNNVAVFSSNFALYTNMSDRVMNTLSQFTPLLEVYSVDEAFLDLTGFSDIENYIRKIKKTVEQWTGIPVSIGVGPTKTLAKVANHISKKNPENEGLFIMMDTATQDAALAKVDVGDVWGIGRKTQAQLYSLNIMTAKDFRDFKNHKLIKKMFTKVGLQKKEELQGFPRFELQTLIEKKKSIVSSRSFGSSVTDLVSLREAVASYATAATEKLRRQGSVCTTLNVYARTSRHGDKAYYSASNTQKMMSGSSDTRKIIRYALHALEKLYKAGYVYKKASVQLSGICDRSQTQISLLEEYDTSKAEDLMNCMDSINKKYGPRTVFPAACGVGNKAWAMNRNLLSPQYVTGWTQLRKVK